jgi:hypothetical protein
MFGFCISLDFKVIGITNKLEVECERKCGNRNNIRIFNQCHG